MPPSLPEASDLIVGETASMLNNSIEVRIPGRAVENTENPADGLKKEI